MTLELDDERDLDEDASWGEEDGPTELTLPDPHPLQRRILADRRRFKLCPLGRRTGKDRLNLVAALCGHGGGRGVLDGFDVAWLAPDYGQARIIWNEEIRPRFKNVPGVRLIEGGDEPLTAYFFDVGKLQLHTAENVDKIRGMGKRLAGVVINEAAHMALRYAWRQVIRPTLMDNKGWAIITSTTNSGEDGSTDDQGNRLTPSYFNTLCDEVEQGKRSIRAWALFEGTALDNPHIDPAEFAEMVAEYPPGSLALEEEVYARRLQGGGRLLCLPQLSQAVHVIPDFVPPTHWPQFGALDWGYAHNFVFCRFTVDEDGTIYVLDSLWLHRKEVHEQIAAVRAWCATDQLEYIVAGHDMWHEHRARRKQDDDTPTMAARWAAEGIPLTMANIARQQGLANLRHYTAWKGLGPERDGKATDGDPRLYFCDTPGNRRLFEQCQTIRTDEKKREEPEVLDADPRNGNGGDDGFTCLRYGVASRPWAARQEIRALNRGAWHPANLAAEAAQRQVGGKRMMQVLEQRRQGGAGMAHLQGDGLVL